MTEPRAAVSNGAVGPKQENHHHRAIPNKDLTPLQIKAKRALKKQLKAQQKRVKLETRLSHAIRRKDPIVEQQTREELQRLFGHNNQQQQQQQHTASQSLVGTNNDEKLCKENSITSKDTGAAPQQLNQNQPSTTMDNIMLPMENSNDVLASSIVQDIYRQLQKQRQQRASSTEKQQQQQDDILATKQEQHRQAISLLKHMTKGTQDRSMFDNADALWGYTRQKFYERAMLVQKSFGRLNPIHREEETQISSREHSLRDLAWNKLARVRNICSVGCGPGNDAVGVVSFLRSIQQQDDQQQQTKQQLPCLDSAILMDWAMEEWKDAVVDPLCSILMPQHIGRIETSFCDVTESLALSIANQQAFRLLCGQEQTAKQQQEEDEEETPQQQSSITFPEVDLVLFSYLLAEQRGLWESFVKDLVAHARPGALFYFAEPTPWQLHHLCKMCVGQLDFVWLDSSMNFPALQPLDNRVGPGVLLGMKKP